MTAFCVPIRSEEITGSRNQTTGFLGIDFMHKILSVLLESSHSTPGQRLGFICLQTLPTRSTYCSMHVAGAPCTKHSYCSTHKAVSGGETQVLNNPQHCIKPRLCFSAFLVTEDKEQMLRPSSVVTQCSVFDPWEEAVGESFQVRFGKRHMGGGGA